MKLALKTLIPGALLTLAFAVGAGAQASAATPAVPVAKGTEAAPAPAHAQDVHHRSVAVDAKREAEMKAECAAMATRRQEMQDKVAAMDAKLDKLVLEMNATKDSKAVDAMEKPMAALLTELVAQRKEMHSMMVEMQPAMMDHMMRHGHMAGMRSGVDCPMMKIGQGTAPKPDPSMAKK